MGTAATLAMVGFGQVDEFEVEGKGAGELIGAKRVLCDGGEMELGWRCVAFAAGDGGLAESFDILVDAGCSLLAEHLAEQHAERTDIATERG